MDDAQHDRIQEAMKELHEWARKWCGDLGVRLLR